MGEQSAGNEATESIADIVRDVHRRYPTGVTIVTVRGEDGRPRGLAVNAFTSVSLDPPLILFAINGTSGSYPSLFAADHIAVNVVGQSQAHVVRAFSRPSPDRFAGIAWHEGSTGAPLIDGTTGHFELAVQYKIPAYTHTLFIGEVVAAGHTDEPALIYLGRELYRGDHLVPSES